MKEYKLSEALGNMPDDLLLEATKIKRKNTAARRFLRVAAIAAVLALLLTVLGFWPVGEENYVIGPGLLVVRAYGAESNTDIPVEGVVLEEGSTLAPDLFWDGSYSSHGRGLPLHLSIQDDLYPGMDITLECSVSDGSLRHDPLPLDKDSPEYEKYHEHLGYFHMLEAYLGNHCVTKNNYKLYWRPDTLVFDEEKYSYDYQHNFKDSQAFLDIIIRADGQIVGYAVIEFYADLDRYVSIWGYEKFYARVLKTVSFPKVDGQYQNVSREYVEKQFQQIHAGA